MSIAAKKLAPYKLAPQPQLMMPWHPGVTVGTGRAAKMLGCSSSTIVRMIEDGTLEGFKLRKNKRNSPYKVIRDSVLRVAEEWRQEVRGHLDHACTSRAAATAGAAPRESTQP